MGELKNLLRTAIIAVVTYLLLFGLLSAAITPQRYDIRVGLPADATLLFFLSRGFTLTDPVRDTISVSSFLTTSAQGYAVSADGVQTQGTYAVGAAATEEIDEGTTARIHLPVLTQPEEGVGKEAGR